MNSTNCGPITLLPLLAGLFLADVQAQDSASTIPGTEDSVVARVHTTDRERILRLSNEYDLWYYIWREGYAVIQSDLASLPPDAIIDHEITAGLKRATAPWGGTGTIPARPCYRTVEQTYADLEAIATNKPQLAQWLDIGDSWEKVEGLGGYDLNSLVLTNQEIPGPKPVFMAIAASHARELATAEAATRFAEALADGYGIDPDITWILDYFEVHVITPHNPDGRKMAEAECTSGCAPSWRKNTNQDYCVANPGDRGADLNRNAGTSFWGGPSSSGNQCNQTYRGPSESSEPETGALETHAAATFPDFRDAPPNDFATPADSDADGVFLSIHSAGDIVFYPWEGSDDTPPNLTGLRALAQKMGFTTTFAACQNCFLGPASGTNVDHIYEKLGVPAFTFEIGSSFGQSCTSFENTVLPQTLEGLFTALRHTRRSYQTPLGPDIQNVLFTPGPNGGTLTAIADDGRRAVNGGGEPIDQSQAIAEARYSVGAPPWLATESFPMDAVDGAFDESEEQVTAAISAAQISGTQLVYVFAQDADGNAGPPAATWVTVEEVFESGFESPQP